MSILSVTDLRRLPHDLRNLRAELVPSGAEGAAAVCGELGFGLFGRIQQLVELQDLLLDGVQVPQPLSAVRLPLPLKLRLLQTLLLRLPQTQVDDLKTRTETIKTTVY